MRVLEVPPDYFWKRQAAVCGVNVEELTMTRAQASGAGSGRIMFMIH